MVTAFLTFYGNGTNTLAEFLALKEGIELCISMDINNLIVECDSQLVVHAMQQMFIGHWSLQYVLRTCLKSFPSSFSIQHQYRQAKVVADRLAT